LILDEPTTGLDPHTRKCVWDTLRQLKEENGLTLFLTTHYMEEAAQADSIVIMDHGEIKTSGTPEQLRLAHSRDKLILVSKKTDSLAVSLQSKRIGFDIDKDRVTIPLHDSFSALGIVEHIRDHIDGFEVVRGNLDDVFVNLTGYEKGAEA
jgi:multidrug/hemolysin transport system ATP-binding protein